MKYTAVRVYDPNNPNTVGVPYRADSYLVSVVRAGYDIHRCDTWNIGSTRGSNIGLHVLDMMWCSSVPCHAGPTLIL